MIEICLVGIYLEDTTIRLRLDLDPVENFHVSLISQKKHKKKEGGVFV